MLNQNEKRKITITMQVFDCRGNLATAPDGAFLILNMINDVQFGPGCEYMITPDPNVPGLYTLFFREEIPAGTDALRFYVIEPCEFYISSVTVQIR